MHVHDEDAIVGAQKDQILNNEAPERLRINQIIKLMMHKEIGYQLVLKAISTKCYSNDAKKQRFAFRFVVVLIIDLNL